MRSILLVGPRGAALPLALTLAAVGATLGTSATAKEPDADLARAKARVEQVQQLGAREFAAIEMTAAESNLQLAETAAAKGKEGKARDLAVRAELDAELAEAKLRRHQAETSAAEVQSGTAVLKDEEERARSIPAPIVAPNVSQPTTVREAL